MERPAEKPKSIVGKPLIEVKEVLDQNFEALMNKPLVVDVRIGEVETEEIRQLALHVYLKSEPTPEQLQTFAIAIDRVPVFYIIAGKPVPYEDSSVNAPRIPQSPTVG